MMCILITHPPPNTGIQPTSCAPLRGLAGAFEQKGTVLNFALTQQLGSVALCLNESA